MNHKCYYVVLLLIVITCTSLNAQYDVDDWKWRDTWMEVEQLFKYTDLRPDAFVADIGCHEGYLTMHLARKVGKLGKVYAVDIRTDRLEKLKVHAKEHKFDNIRIIKGDDDNPKLPENLLDVIYVIDTYHEMDAYKKMLNHFRKALKPGGKILFLEKIKKHMIGKSRSEQVSAHTLSLKYVKRELKEAGFTIVKEVKHFGFWEEDKTKQMWLLVAKKL